METGPTSFERKKNQTELVGLNQLVDLVKLIILKI
jgi:hypothetical protein